MLLLVVICVKGEKKTQNIKNEKLDSRYFSLYSKKTRNNDDDDDGQWREVEESGGECVMLATHEEREKKERIFPCGYMQSIVKQ